MFSLCVLRHLVSSDVDLCHPGGGLLHELRRGWLLCDQLESNRAFQGVFGAVLHVLSLKIRPTRADSRLKSREMT